MLFLSGFELCSRWVPLLVDKASVAVNNSPTQDIHQTNHIPLC